MSKIEELVRKLHSKAVDPSLTQDEAEAFMKKVQELLAEHNLSEGILYEGMQIDKIEITEDFYNATGKDFSWFRTMAHYTSKMYFSKMVRLRYEDSSFYSFVGREHNRRVAMEMYVYFMDTIHKLSRKHYPSDLKGQYEFKKGAAIRLTQRIYDEIERIQNQAGRDYVASGKNTLPAVYAKEFQEIDLYLEKYKISTPRKSSPKMTNATRDGYKAANTIGFTTQIGESKTNNPQIGG